MEKDATGSPRAEETRYKPNLASRLPNPETGQDYGSRAKQVASNLAFGKNVKIQPVDKDRYGRTVAEVILPDGRSLNREMIGQGAAWWYREVRRITA
jgi:endonuclease YncB( thermonuclease family)